MSTIPSMTLPPGTAPQSPTQGPLSPEHYAQFEAAQRRGKRLRKVARFATISGWISGLCTGLALLIAAVSSLVEGRLDLVGFAVSAALIVVMINEFRGAAKIRRVDLSGP